MESLGRFERDIANMLLGFGNPSNLTYNAGGTQDMRPVRCTELPNGAGYKCVCRTVGISPEDVKVEVNGNKISISGKTTFEDSEYTAKYDIPISKDLSSNIDSIKYKTLNGLTHVYIYIKKPSLNRIIAERI